MRTAVLNLAEMGRLPDERIGDEEFWKPWDAAVRVITKPATDEEAACILDLFPDEERSSYGLAWHLLHFVESAPGWPQWALLDDRSPWVVFLRERAERGREWALIRE